MCVWVGGRGVKGYIYIHTHTQTHTQAPYWPFGVALQSPHIEAYTQTLILDSPGRLHLPRPLPRSSQRVIIKTLAHLSRCTPHINSNFPETGRDTWYRVPGTWYQVPGTRYLERRWYATNHQVHTWNGNCTHLVPKLYPWCETGMDMERSWNEHGTQIASMVRAWSEHGTEIEQKYKRCRELGLP